MLSRRFQQTALALFTSAVLAANILLFLPISLYLGNLAEFSAPLLDIISVNLIFGTALVILLALLGSLLSANLARRYVTLIALLAILSWLQGNILVWDYGLLDGKPIDWSTAAWRGWLDLAIWGATLGVGIFFPFRIHTPVVRITFAVLVIQLASTAFVLYENRTNLAQHQPISSDPQTLRAISQLSAKKNIIHIIADGFQADVFAEILTDTNGGEELRRALDGFVHFPEQLGAFPLTHMSVPAILTGQIYKNEQPRKDFFATTIGQSSIFHAAKNAGYKVNLAVPSSLRDLYAPAPHDNALYLLNSNHISAADYQEFDTYKLFDLSLFRALPHFLKPLIYNDQLWLMQSQLHAEQYKVLDFFSHLSFLKQFRESLSAELPQPVYSYIHVMLSHHPWVTGPGCQYAGGTLPTLRPVVKLQAKCGLMAVAQLLTRMRELGIYDDATIVLMGDHGAYVRPTGFNPGDGQAIVKRPMTIALAHPLLAIKRPHAQGSIQASGAYSWIIDTPATIADLAKLDADFPGDSVFHLPNGVPRARRYHIYTFNSNERHKDYLPPIHEFNINGSVLNADAWQRGQVFTPQGPVPAKPVE